MRAGVAQAVRLLNHNALARLEFCNTANLTPDRGSRNTYRSECLLATQAQLTSAFFANPSF